VAWLRLSRVRGEAGTADSTVTVCAPPDGREHQLASVTADVISVKFDGPVIGFAEQATNVYSEAQTLLVFEANGRKLIGARVEKWPLGRAQPTPGFDGYTVDATGDVAWVETNAGGKAHTGETLLEKAPNRREQTLARGTAITQLDFGHGSLTWVNDGHSASARAR
jgi:hypothetical protein